MGIVAKHLCVSDFVNHKMLEASLSGARAQARTNARSDRVVLDFLFLLHQGKRKSKKSKLIKLKEGTNSENI